MIGVGLRFSGWFRYPLAIGGVLVGIAGILVGVFPMNVASSTHITVAMIFFLGSLLSANPEAYLVLLLREGNYEEARDILVDLQRLFARAGEWIDPFLEARKNPDASPAARDALARAARERQVSLKYLFGAWVYLGDADAAIDAAFELLGEPGEFDVEFLFVTETAVLRRHPRFGELVRAIGLDRYWEHSGWPPACVRRGESIECR
jgi:hypothetical protein